MLSATSQAVVAVLSSLDLTTSSKAYYGLKVLPSREVLLKPPTLTMTINAMKHMEPDGAIEIKDAPADTVQVFTERPSRLMEMSSTETELLNRRRDKPQKLSKAARQPSEQKPLLSDP